MKKLLLIIFSLSLINCNESKKILVTKENSKPDTYIKKTWSHEFEENEIVYLKPDSIPCFVDYKHDNNHYELISLDKNSLFNSFNNGTIDTCLIFPKKIK